MTFDFRGAADRIKGLISMSDKAQLERAAARLGVEEQELREAIERPSASMTRVVAAVVRVYGLDPTWILTGTYDSATHRIAIARDESALNTLLAALIGSNQEQPHQPSAQP